MAKTIRGGDVRQFVLGGREFDVASESAFEVSPSGFANEFKAAGNGKMVGAQKRQLGMIDSVELVMDNSRQDLEFLATKRDAGEPVPVSMTLADGTVYAGSVGIEGEVKVKTDTGTVTLGLRGPRLEQI